MEPVLAHSQEPHPGIADPQAIIADLLSPAKRRETIVSAFGAKVSVAVVDTGIEANHREIARAGGLAGGTLVSKGSDGPVFLPCDGRDLAGHGTACAGIIRRIAPSCDVYSVRVLDETASGDVDSFLAGLSWCLDNDIKVINLSLGITTLTPQNVLAFYKLIHRAYYQGSIVVCAASNGTGRSLPSCLAPVISVQATANNALRYRDHNEIEFATRGIYIRTPWPPDTYMMMTGDSFAAPMVSGLVARIVCLIPTASYFQVKTVLWALAHDDELMSDIIANATTSTCD
jgi:subtilisin family serine protease